MPHWSYFVQQVASGSVPGLTEEQPRFPAQMRGCYIGELLRRKWGGEWIQLSPNTYPELIVKGRQVSPSGTVAESFESSGASSVLKFVEEITAA